VLTARQHAEKSWKLGKNDRGITTYAGFTGTLKLCCCRHKKNAGILKGKFQIPCILVQRPYFTNPGLLSITAISNS